MPAPTKQPLRVAECTGCGQLFAVYETTGEVACPACETANAIESLEVAELQVATSVPVEVVPPPEAVVARPEPTPAIEPPATGEPEEKRSPTVAEWLVRSEAETLPAPTRPPAADPAQPELAAKPSLSESLGWSPGSFRLDNNERPSTAEPTTSPAPEIAESKGYNPEPVATTQDFKFDLGATPLNEQPDELSDRVDEFVQGSIESAGLNLEVGDDTPQPAEFDWSQSDTPARRGWFGPVTAAAGLLVVAAPLAYFGWDTLGEGVVAASENREQRASLHDVMTDEEPPIPWEEPASLPEGTSKAEPIVDPATKPASFDAERFNEPLADEPSAEAQAVEESTQPQAVSEPAPFESSPPADPFNAPLPESTPPIEASPGRYATQASAVAPVEPFDESVRLPVEPPADRSSLRAQPQIGLVNAPTYGIGELTAAIGPAISASQGFATGTLSDPDQVQAMGQHYARLCHLAQLVTLFEPDPSDPSRLTAELEAADVFKRLFIEAGPREESRQIAGPWIGWTGRPHGGVFFAGKPTDMSLPGQVVQYDFPLGETTVPVITSKKLNTQRFMTAGADEIGVIGVVVENPRQWIAGYEGDAERVVWARKTLPLREPKTL